MKIKIDTKKLTIADVNSLTLLLNSLFEFEEIEIEPKPPRIQTTEPAEVIDGVTVDSEGVPWDCRIHSESKTLVSDGTWRKRRNIAPNLVNAVTAELKAIMNLPGSSPLNKPLHIPTDPKPYNAGDYVSKSDPSTNPGPSLGLSFIELTAQVGELLTTKQAHITDIAEAAKKLGLPTFQALSARPDLIPDFCKLVGIVI